MHCFNSRQEGRVVGSVMSPTECASAYEQLFLSLQELDETSFNKIKHAISDFAHSPVNAYEKVAKKPIEHWTPCSW